MNPNTYLTPGQFNNLPPVKAKVQSAPIDANIIGNTNPIKIPPITPVNFNSTITGVNASLGAPTGGLVPLPPVTTPTPTGAETTTAPTKSLSDTVKELLGLQAPTVDVAGEYAKAEEAAGIQAKQQQVASLTNQINAITAQSQAEQLQLDTPVTGAGNTDVRASLLDKQKAEISRNAAIKILPLAAQLSAATGDLNTAQTHLDKYFGMVVEQANAATTNYNNVVAKAYELFTTSEKAKLDEIKVERANNSAQMKDATDNAQLIAKSALDNGDNATFQALTSIPAPDTSSSTFLQDLQEYNQKVAQATMNMKANPMDALDMQLKRAQIASANRANQGSGVSTQVVEVGGKKLLINSDTGETIRELGAGETGSNTLQLAQAQQNIQEIDALKISEGLAGTVGSYGISRFTPFKIDKAARQEFIAGIEQIRSQLNLDTLIKAKAAGATFGALSDNELQVLASAATKIGTWAKKDGDGKVVAYTTSEKNLKAELDKIGNFAKLDYILKGGNPEEIGVQTMPDGSLVVKNSDGTFTILK